MVGRKVVKLMKNGHIEEATDIDGNCFIELRCYYCKKDKTVKIALYSRKLNEINVKKTRKSNVEELISGISRKSADRAADEVWISKFDLDHAYAQLPFSKNVLELCILGMTGGNFTGYYTFLISFYGLADIPTIFQ